MMTLKDEWIVEQIKREGMRVVTKVIGKVILINPVTELSHDDLETIWDLCNYTEAQHTPIVYNNTYIPIENDMSIYNGMTCYVNDGICLVPMQGATGCVNDDIFIRKHYDTEIGYWIYNNHHRQSDEWRNSSWNEFQNYHKQSRI